MTISATTATTTTTPTPTTTATPGLQGTQDEFLKLFMAQLQNQDPLNPTSGADMVAQLAQFSSVEQATQTNQELTQLVAGQASSASASLSTLVGRTCDADLGTVQVTSAAAVPPIEVTSTGPISGASIAITGPDGKQVASLPIPASGGAITWNGRDANGNAVPPGSYTFAVNSGTTATAITARWHGRIDGVELAADGSYLDMGGIEITPSAIRTIGDSAPATTAITSAAKGAQQ